MQTYIRTHGIELTERVKRFSFQKLDLALDRLHDQVESVSVYLMDTNGPWIGGIDKTCKIVVSFRQSDSIVVEDVDRSVEGVIDRSTDRLGVIASQRADLAKKSRKSQGVLTHFGDENAFD